MSRVTVCFKHGCKLQKPVTFFGVDVRERNHRQLRWTLTYWGVSKTQTIPVWNGTENAIIKKNNSLPNGTLMVDSPWWKLKNRLKQTRQETRESHTQLHTACFVFFVFLTKMRSSPWSCSDSKSSDIFGNWVASRCWDVLLVILVKPWNPWGENCIKVSPWKFWDHYMGCSAGTGCKWIILFHFYLIK